MTSEELIDKLHDAAFRLLSLLESPEPGILSWWYAVGRAVDELTALKDDDKDKSKTKGT